jgi:hypothetical protein
MSGTLRVEGQRILKSSLQSYAAVRGVVVDAQCDEDGVGTQLRWG